MPPPPPATEPLDHLLRRLTAARAVRLHPDLSNDAHDCFFVCVAQALFGGGALERRGAITAAVAALRTMQRGEQQLMTPAAAVDAVAAAARQAGARIAESCMSRSPF